VVVHVETPQEFEDAIGAGATGVEHAAYLQDVPQSLIELIARRRPFVDATFGEYETALALDKIAPAAKAERLRRSYTALRQLSQAGARIVIGTDAPMVAYGSGFHDELAHLVRGI